MKDEASLIIQTVFTLLFFGVLAAGGYLFKNYDKLFGVDPNLPSENSSSRAYSKVQAFVIWIHALFLTGAFALLLH